MKIQASEGTYSWSLCYCKFDGFFPLEFQEKVSATYPCVACLSETLALSQPGVVVSELCFIWTFVHTV